MWKQSVLLLKCLIINIMLNRHQYINDPKNNKSFDYKDGYNDAVRDLIIIVEKQTGVRLKF